MRLDKFIADFERSVEEMPGLLSRWQGLPDAVRDGFFEEMIAMLARRRRAEREALAQGRPQLLRRLAHLHGKLLMAVAEFGPNAGIVPGDIMADGADVAVIDGGCTPSGMAQAA